MAKDVYTYDMSSHILAKHSADALFQLPCACQNLRRLSRVVTRIYAQELRRAGLEVTHFGLLTALAKAGEVNQKRLSAGLAMDSTTLTRTLGLLRKQGWVQAKRGKDRRERVFSLTRAGKQRLAITQPYWEQAERRLRRGLGDKGWKKMKEAVTLLTDAALDA
jgi:DNA-binding MarR family transcriptional regulator